MITKTITLEGGMTQLAQARRALESLSGVIAAEIVSGRNAVRVWQGEDLTDEALLGALTDSGIRGGQIASSVTTRF